MRPKLSYANVVSTLCLFMLLAGGAAFAATQLPKNSVGTKQLKKNAVTGAKVKKNAITGAKVNESTLGTVPAATQAANATNALNATNAADSGTLGGLPSSSFQKQIVVAKDRGTFTTGIGETCTHAPGSEVTIDAPSDGVVVITANFWLRTKHTAGEDDRVQLFIGTSESDCAEGEEGFSTFYTIPSALPTYSEQHVTVPLSRVVEVSPGPHTFYMNAKRSGADVPDFYYTGMVAVFYPS